MCPAMQKAEWEAMHTQAPQSKRKSVGRSFFPHTAKQTKRVAHKMSEDKRRLFNIVYHYHKEMGHKKTLRA